MPHMLQCETVEHVAAEAIAARGTFSLAVPGGSVLKMLGGLAHSKAIDWSRVCVLLMAT